MGGEIQQVIVSIPGAQLTLVQCGESIELFHGEFVIVRLTQQGTPIAFIVKVGDFFQWPVTKDEPVVKLDDLHYLFSLRPPSMVDHEEKIEFISYGVKFSERSESIDSLDKFLSENSCFSAPRDSSIEVSGDAATVGEDEYWKKYAPNVDDYHGVLAKAIAGVSGEIVKGVFICNKAYWTNVQSGGEFLQNGVEDNRGSSSNHKGFGEDAGQVTDDVFATAGHALGTVWNLYKIKKAFIPAFKKGLSTAILQNVGRK